MKLQEYLYNTTKGQVRSHNTFIFGESRTYVKSPSDAPSGAAIKRGARGGIYYDSDAGKTPAKSTESPIAKMIEMQMDVMTNPKQRKYYGLQLNELKPAKTQKLTGKELSQVENLYDSISFKPEMKQCYMNAQKLAQQARFADADIQYMEGFYMFDDMPLHFDHAWVRVNGKDFDPTLKFTGRDSSKVHYFGKPFSAEQVMKNQLKTGQYTSLLRQFFINKTEENIDDYLYDEKKIKDYQKKFMSEIPAKDRALIKKNTQLWETGNDTRKKFSDGKGNYTPERKALHDKIVSDALKGKKTSSVPTATFLAGLPGSGKTSVAAKTFEKESNTVSISNDDIKAMLPEYKENPINATIIHEEASDIKDRILKKVLGNKYNFVLDATFENYDKAIRRVQNLKAKGYKINLVATQLPTHKAMERAHSRFLKTRRPIPYNYIAEVGPKVNNTVKQLKTEVDRYKIYNTDTKYGEAPKRIERMTEQNEDNWDKDISKIYAKMIAKEESRLDDILLSIELNR